MRFYTYQDLLIKKRRLNNCGGKGKNLFLLKSNGFPVPEFVVIPFPAIRDELKGLDRSIQSLFSDMTHDDESLITNAGRIQTVIRRLTFSHDFQSRISEIVRAKFDKNPFLAVRSSAALEDNHSNSFAGMYDSYLFVTKENILSGIRNCIASNFNARVLKYKLIKNINLNECRMAVILQEMIDSSKAGVLFTMNPEGNLNEFLICSAHGQGVGVVQGTADTDSYYLNRNTLSMRVIQPQNRKEIARPERSRSASIAKGSENVLSKPELSQLFTAGKAIESLFEKPQDIEFAIDHFGKIHYLQSREITTIRLEDLKILDNSNIVESYPGISLPLTFSLARQAYYGTVLSAAKWFKLSDTEINNYSLIFSDLIVHLKGRIYYNLHNWYSIVQRILISDQGLRSWEDFLGVSKGERRMPKLPGLKKIRRIVRTLRLFTSHEKHCHHFYTDFNKAYTEFRALLLKAGNQPQCARELFTFYEEKSKHWFEFWGITLINDLFVHRFFALLKKLISSYGLDYHENLINDLLCGIEGVESEKPIFKLLDLKTQINKDPKLKKLFNASPGVIINQLMNEKHTTFAINFFEYIELYGDRALEELKLESPNFRTHPELFVHLLKNYLNNHLEVTSFKEKQQNIRSKAEALIASRQFVLSIKTLWFRYVLQKTRQFIKNRENMRFARTRAYSLVRELIIQIGYLMVQSGVIEKQEDIFYLQLEDLRTFCKDGSRMDRRQEIDRIKREYKFYEQISLPDKIVYSGNHIPNVSNFGFLNDTETNCLQGIAISKGEVTGISLVLDHPDMSSQVDNRILVTRMTDPGWIFLMAQAKGLISEKGSPLSHTAIVGRELGIPTIVNVERATAIIKSGNTIYMNANNGRIRILD